jgi:hypothetical protein
MSRPKRKRIQSMSLKQHHDLGAKLRELKLEIDAIGDLLEKHFPLEMRRRWGNACTRLMDIRSPLENALIKLQIDLGVDDGKVPTCYYGSTDQLDQQ